MSVIAIDKDVKFTRKPELKTYRHIEECNPFLYVSCCSGIYSTVRVA